MTPTDPTPTEQAAKERARAHYANDIEFDENMFGQLSPATRNAIAGFEACLIEHVIPAETSIDLLSATVARLRSLVQVCVNALQKSKRSDFFDNLHIYTALLRAKEEGFNHEEQKA